MKKYIGFLVVLSMLSAVFFIGAQPIRLSGFDAASPGEIGGTTPAAGTFTTLNATTVVATGSMTGSIDIITDSDGIALTASQARGNAMIMTGAGDVDLPDTCDSATGANVLVFVRDASETVSLTVQDTSDTIIYPGLSLGANDELDSPGTAGDWVSVVCMETNKWYVVGNRGAWTDGGVAD